MTVWQVKSKLRHFFFLLLTTSYPPLLYHAFSWCAIHFWENANVHTLLLKLRKNFEELVELLEDLEGGGAVFRPCIAWRSEWMLRQEVYSIRPSDLLGLSGGPRKTRRSGHSIHPSIHQRNNQLRGLCGLQHEELALIRPPIPPAAPSFLPSPFQVT